MTDQKLRMDAYYYGFDETGAPEIDLILSAVACAGKSFHHTDQWNESSEAWPGHTGNSPAEWIQNAAQIAADGNKQASAEIARLHAENERLSLRDFGARPGISQDCESDYLAIIEDLERARISGFEGYDFTRLKDRKGDQKVFEITIETERGCDIEEGEYTVRVTNLLGCWMGEDDFSLITDAVAEVISDLELPEEGHTSFIAYESGERQDVFWTKWFEIATTASVLAEVQP